MFYPFAMFLTCHFELSVGIIIVLFGNLYVILDKSNKWKEMETYFLRCIARQIHIVWYCLIHSLICLFSFCSLCYHLSYSTVAYFSIIHLYFEIFEKIPYTTKYWVSKMYALFLTSEEMEKRNTSALLKMINRKCELQSAKAKISHAFVLKRHKY